MLTRSAVWNPWRELEALSRDVSSTFAPERRWNMDWANEGPAFNVYTGREGVVLTAELPGFDPEQFEVVAERETVTIRGRHAEEELDEGVRAHVRERHTLEFEKSFRLPFAVDAEHTEAIYDKGVLTVRLHRPAEQKPQKIGVRTV